MRQIVLAVETSSTAGLPDIVGRSQEEVGYHAHLLIGNGLAEGFSVRNLGHRLPFDSVSNLTVAGHEFAELARNDDRWNAAMTQAQGGGAVTLAILQNLLTHSPRKQTVLPNGKSGPGKIHVIANKPLTFLKDGYGGEQITVRPGSGPQLVPAWIRDTDTFRFAIRDGSVLEVEIKTPALPTSSAPHGVPGAPPAPKSRTKRAHDPQQAERTRQTIARSREANSDQEQAKRRRSRSTWLDAKIELKRWSSDADIVGNGGRRTTRSNAIVRARRVRARHTLRASLPARSIAIFRMYLSKRSISEIEQIQRISGASQIS